VNRLTTAREELIAIALGDLTQILDRLEAVTPLMNEARCDLADAARNLAAKVEPFRSEMRQVASAEQYRAVHYVRDQVEQTSAFRREQQTKALEATGRKVLREEIGNTLQHLIDSLQAVIRGAKRRETVRMHVTTAVISAASTACLLLHFLPRP